MARGMSVARACAFVAFVTATGAACHLLVPVGDVLPAKPEPDTGDAPLDAGDDAADPCAPTPPAPPAPRHDPSGAPIVFAAVRWSLDPVGDDAFCDSSGFDLDGLVTGPPPRCEENRACAQLGGGSGPHPCDGPNGEDNVLRDILGFAKTFPGGGEALRAYDFNHSIATGISTALLELHDYSGEKDDESVVVQMYGAVGHEGLDASVSSGKDILALPHVWDGSQDLVWIVSKDSIVGEGLVARARVRADGYVRDHVLVVPQLGPMLMPVILGGSPLAAYGGLLVGRIHPPSHPGDRHRLTHVRMGLRFAVREALSMMGGIHTPGTVGQLCSQPREFYEAFYRPTLCAFADLPADEAPPDPTVPCGDISAGAHFTFVESRLSRDDKGHLAPGPTLPLGTELPCPDDAGTQWCDDCVWEGPRRCDAGSY